MKITRGNLRSIIREMLLTESSSIEASELESIVDNAIKKLELESVQNLKQFMLEIANAESGHNPRGLDQITHYASNPFQLTGIAIRATSARGDGSPERSTQAMRDAFYKIPSIQNPWHEQSVEEVKANPKLSAIAAAMYIMMQLRGQPISSNLRGRAAQWESLYNREAALISDREDSLEKTESQIDMYVRKNSKRM